MDSAAEVLMWLEGLELFPGVPLRDAANPANPSRELIAGLASSALLIPLLKRLNRLKVYLGRMDWTETLLRFLF